jgi:hypothetical protein
LALRSGIILDEDETNEPGQDEIIYNYIPLPPERRAEWERAMRILTDIIESVLEKNLQK